MSLEYLGEEPSRRFRWVLPAVVVLVSVVALLGWWSEHVRQQADETLATAVVQVQEDARAGQAKVLSTLSYASPMIWSSEVSEAVRADLRKVVQGSAADVVSGLRQVREDVASTRVLPWQGDQVADRAAVLRLVDAYLGRFEEIASDARQIGVVMARPEPVAPLVSSASREPVPSPH
jgi:hypothetical protein